MWHVARTLNGVVSGAKIPASEAMYVSNVASWAKITSIETMFGTNGANGAKQQPQKRCM